MYSMPKTIKITEKDINNSQKGSKNPESEINMIKVENDQKKQDITSEKSLKAKTKKHGKITKLIRNIHSSVKFKKK